MTRNLETLIEQFNRASEIDRISRIHEVPVKMVNLWTAELSPEEKVDFEAHVAKVVRDTAHRLGYESSEAWFYDIGQKIFSGLKTGLNTS